MLCPSWQPPLSVAAQDDGAKLLLYRSWADGKLAKAVTAETTQISRKVVTFFSFFSHAANGCTMI
jgi:hypothetical protein